MNMEEKFVHRLIELRQQKGVSARDMSLSMGQSEGYINKIESKAMLPSMLCFFYICEYLGITPKEFFEFENKEPSKINMITEEMKTLNPKKLDTVAAVVRDMKR